MSTFVFLFLLSYIEFSIQGFPEPQLYECAPNRYVREDMPCYPIEERCLHNVPEDTYLARSYLHCSENLEDSFGPPYIWTRKYCPQNLKFSFKAQLCLPNWNYIKTEFGEWIMDKNNLPKYS